MADNKATTPDDNKVITDVDPETVSEKGNAKHPINLHDPSVTFIEYQYWAKITREEERIANLEYLRQRKAEPLADSIKKHLGFSGKKEEPKTDAPLAITDGTAAAAAAAAGGAKEASGAETDKIMVAPSEGEWKQASRALRTASWGACFYLITTDILGPLSTPWSFAQTGYGPGILLYTVFGATAGYSAFVMWKTFLGLDSDRFPLRSYGDIFFRLFGPTTRHSVNIALAIQMILSVCALILGQGQSITQMSRGESGSQGICFVACMVIFMAAGMLFAQIRSYQHFSRLAFIAVLSNLGIIILSCVVVTRHGPNFLATSKSFGPQFGEGPIHTYAWTPPSDMTTGGVGFVASLNGLNQAIYSYGGCLVFISFMSEMRHPMDFWKAIICAESFIYCMYLFFGIYVYSFHGQFTYNPIQQGLTPYRFQTAANAMYFVSGLIAAALYANIGFKVVYVEVFQEIFKFPPLSERKGQIAWIVSIPVYFSIAFVIAAAIPQFSYVSGLIAALFILTFTYTLPAIMGMAYWIQKDAVLPQEVFDPISGTVTFVDSGFKRWSRGFWKKPIMHTWNFLYMLGAIATTILGVYSSVVQLIDAFNGGSAASSFGCEAAV